MTPREIEDALRRHVEDLGDKECVWGVDDCTRWAADWAEARLGRSIDLPRYTSEAEARALIARAGSLLALWSAQLARNGIPEAYRPEIGDVGIVETKRYGQIGVIFTHGGVALWRGTKGVAAIQPRPTTLLKAWSLR